MFNQTITLLLLLIFVGSNAHSQTMNMCFYGETNKSKDVCKHIQNSFTSNLETEKAILKLLRPLGLKPNFVVVPCSDIDNCAAITWSDGLRYIVYDNAFMEDIERSANTNWTSLSILAHELGHHLNGHTLTRSSLSETREEELEADEFSGFLLAKLGASLEQALAAMNTLNHPSCYDDIYSDHPCKQKRLDAIKKGFANGKSGGVLPTSMSGISTGYYQAGIVNEFGGTSLGGNYCFYKCSFENIMFSINFDNMTSNFTSTYKESTLYGCNPHSSNPMQEIQELSGKSDYVNYNKDTGKVSASYRVTSGSDLGYVLTYTGTVKDNSQVEGYFSINRATNGNFKGFILNMYIPLNK